MTTPEAAKITTDTVTKNPKRVEQGRKLAEISRQAKAKKAQAAQAAQATQAAQADDHWLPDCSLRLAALAIVAVGGVAAIAYCTTRGEPSFRWDPPPVIVADSQPPATPLDRLGD